VNVGLKKTQTEVCATKGEEKVGALAALWRFIRQLLTSLTKAPSGFVSKNDCWGSVPARVNRYRLKIAAAPRTQVVATQSLYPD
jgi:hypothetical protein